jgi:hypothetical protein
VPGFALKPRKILSPRKVPVGRHQLADLVLHNGLLSKDLRRRADTLADALFNWLDSYRNFIFFVFRGLGPRFRIGD